MGKRWQPKNNKKLEQNYLQSIVIVHGLSEKAFCDNVSRTLRLSQKVISKDGGHSSIQVTSLDRQLNRKYFKSPRLLKSEFANLNIVKSEIKDCLIFSILDVDDCTEKQKKDYINGVFKSQYWFGHAIQPIYNDPNLEETMKNIGIEVVNKKAYSSIFEPNKWSDEALIDLWKRLKKVKNTNLDRYLEYCLRCKKKI